MRRGCMVNLLVSTEQYCTNSCGETILSVTGNYQIRIERYMYMHVICVILVTLIKLVSLNKVQPVLIEH